MADAERFTPVERRDLSAAVARQLRDLIVRGDIPAGEPLTERDVARRLDVSRTPVREALAELQREGFVEPRGRRGLHVAATSRRQVEEIYPLIALLERFGLETAPPAKAALDELDALNAEFAEAAAREDKIALDRRWHDALLANFDNREAQAVIDALKAHALRYENHYFLSAEQGRRSIREHAEVVRQLRDGRRAAAAKILHAHWFDAGVRLAAIVEKNLGGARDEP